MCLPRIRDRYCRPSWTVQWIDFSVIIDKRHCLKSHLHSMHGIPDLSHVGQINIFILFLFFRFHKMHQGNPFTPRQTTELEMSLIRPWRTENVRLRPMIDSSFMLIVWLWGRLSHEHEL